MAGPRPSRGDLRRRPPRLPAQPPHPGCSRTLRSVLATDTGQTEPEPSNPYGLVAPALARPSVSRRGALGLVGAGSHALLVVSAGQSIEAPCAAPHCSPRTTSIPGRPRTAFRSTSARAPLASGPPTSAPAGGRGRGRVGRGVGSHGDMVAVGATGAYALRTRERQGHVCAASRRQPGPGQHRTGIPDGVP